jgi:hypothetical protein
MRSLALVLSATLLCVPTPSVGKVIFKANFETGDLSEWTNTGTRSQNATPRNVQVVTDIVQEGKYAAKFTIHDDDVFNPQQLRVQVGGPRVTVEDGSDTYLSFYLYMAEPPKDRDNFFYWEGQPPPRYDNVMTWWLEPKEGGGAMIGYGTGNLGRNGTEWHADFPIGRWHQLVMHIHWSEDRPGKREHASLVRWRLGAGQEAQDQGSGVRLLLSARNSSQPASSVGRHHLLRQLHPRRHAGRSNEEVG